MLRPDKVVAGEGAVVVVVVVVVVAVGIVLVDGAGGRAADSNAAASSSASCETNECATERALSASSSLWSSNELVVAASTRSRNGRMDSAARWSACSSSASMALNWPVNQLCEARVFFVWRVENVACGRARFSAAEPLRRSEQSRCFAEVRRGFEPGEEESEEDQTNAIAAGNDCLNLRSHAQ